jgi:pimeloyl-ACP methyl ester carboxylesterase
MGTYVQVGDLKTWFDEAGSGEPLVLLHGGIVTNETWGGQMAELPARFHVYAPERRGHGHTPDVEGPFHYATFAADTIAFLENVVKEPAHLVGWSDGGIIGLLVASQRPDLLKKLVAISANYNLDAVPEQMKDGLGTTPADSDEMAMMRQLYEASTPDGPEHWPVVYGKFIEMATSEPDIAVEELAKITTPTLVMAGDDDMITLEHTQSLYWAIPGAELAIVPGTSHCLTMEKPELVNKLIVEFLTKDPVPEMMPLRRAPASTHP